MAVGHCTCGCPSIDLVVTGNAPAAEGLTGRVLPAEGRVRPVVDGGVVGDIIVFVHDGRLSCLEYIYYDNPPTSWPSLDRIDLVV